MKSNHAKKEFCLLLFSLALYICFLKKSIGNKVNAFLENIEKPSKLQTKLLPNHQAISKYVHDFLRNNPLHSDEFGVCRSMNDY